MRPAACLAIALGLALAGGPLRAQPLTREELVQALAARDHQIADLEQRLAALERARAAPPITTLPQASAAPPAVPATAQSDDEAELAALSRTLVQRGGLVLPPWRAEFVPSFGYVNRETQGLALAPTPEGIPTVADQRLRDDQLRASATFRLGLPWASQAEVRVPYAWLRRSRSLGDGTQAINEGSGLGDVEVTFSHQLARERGWRPDLVGAVSWRFDTGRDPFRARVAAVAPGSGTQEFGARLTALKSSDPMVFFTTLSYAHDLAAQESAGAIQFGDSIGLDLGAVLSVSPETSLTFGLSQAFRSRTQVDRIAVPGSDTAAASLLLGFDRVLTPNLLLDLSLGVGLTRDAPDYTIQLSLPFRFR
ncbi:MAG: hypothetical protein JWQ97_3151 [Phenylobacterium sp.]|nr:hypothetical protein [Phenylobacterium sp.]